MGGPKWSSVPESPPTGHGTPVTLLLHLQGTYLLRTETLGPDRTSHQKRPPSGPSEPAAVRPLAARQPEPVTNSWDFPAAASNPPLPCPLPSPQAPSPPCFHFQKHSSPSFPVQSLQPLSPASPGLRLRFKAQEAGSGAVDAAGDSSPCQLLLRSAPGQWGTPDHCSLQDRVPAPGLPARPTPGALPESQESRTVGLAGRVGGTVTALGAL